MNLCSLSRNLRQRQSAAILNCLYFNVNGFFTTSSVPISFDKATIKYKSIESGIRLQTAQEYGERVLSWLFYVIHLPWMRITTNIPSWLFDTGFVQAGALSDAHDWAVVPRSVLALWRNETAFVWLPPVWSDFCRSRSNRRRDTRNRLQGQLHSTRILRGLAACHLHKGGARLGARGTDSQPELSSAAVLEASGAHAGRRRVGRRNRNWFGNGAGIARRLDAGRRQIRRRQAARWSGVPAIKLLHEAHGRKRLPLRHRSGAACVGTL